MGRSCVQRCHQLALGGSSSESAAAAVAAVAAELDGCCCSAGGGADANPRRCIAGAAEVTAAMLLRLVRRGTRAAECEWRGSGSGSANGSRAAAIDTAALVELRRTDDCSAQRAIVRYMDWSRKKTQTKDARLLNATQREESRVSDE